MEGVGLETGYMEEIRDNTKEIKELLKSILATPEVLEDRTGILGVIYGLRPSTNPGDRFVGSLCAGFCVVSIILTALSLLLWG